MVGWYGNGAGSLGWLGIGAFWPILLGLITWLLVRLLRRSRHGRAPSNSAPALEILDKRLAGGQIDTPAWQAQRTALVAAQGNGK